MAVMTTAIVGSGVIPAALSAQSIICPWLSPKLPFGIPAHESPMMPSPVAEQVLSRLEECLLDIDELGWALAGARLSHAVETLRSDLADNPGRLTSRIVSTADYLHCCTDQSPQRS